jgi:tetratricopeptide (TPR) repeat protein
MGNPQQAIDDYSAALALDPQQWEALGNRGVLHYFSGALEAAIADFSAAIALKPEEADLYGNRATALLACNRSMEATQDLQRAAELARTETERIEFETRLSDIVPKPEMQRAKAV